MVDQSEESKGKEPIYVIESEKLRSPTQSTLKMLQRATTVITDESADFDYIMKRFKYEVTREANKSLYQGARDWGSAFAQRFVVIRNLDTLKRFMQCDSKLRNRDKSDRGYLLGKILSMLDPKVWQKLPQLFYIRKFAEIDPQLSNAELV